MPDDSGCTLHRIKLPFYHLNKNGYRADWIPLKKVLQALLDDYDVFVLPRLGGDMPDETWYEVKRMGKAVVVEWDDDISAIPEGNPAKEEVDEEAVRAFTRTAELATGATTTTDYLAGVLSTWNPNVWVLPNCVDPEVWDAATKGVKQNDHLTVGWFGGDSHKQDLLMIKDAIEEVARRNPEVHFVIAGYGHDIFEIEEKRLHRYSWVPLDRYQALVAQIDIGLCPLVDNHFNRCKSPLKALEYGVIGIPVVASPTVYSKVINHGSTGYIAYTHDDWVRWIEKLVRDHKLKKSMSKAIKQDVRRRFNIAERWREWALCYESMLKSP